MKIIPCKGKTSLFFPDRGVSNYEVERAKAICEGCPVRWDCLQRGLNQNFGIWAGLSNKSLKTYRRKVSKGADPKRVLEKILKVKVTWVPEQSGTAAGVSTKKSETAGVG